MTEKRSEEGEIFFNPDYQEVKEILERQQLTDVIMARIKDGLRKSAKKVIRTLSIGNKVRVILLNDRIIEGYVTAMTDYTDPNTAIEIRTPVGFYQVGDFTQIKSIRLIPEVQNWTQIRYCYTCNEILTESEFENSHVGHAISVARLVGSNQFENYIVIAYTPRDSILKIYPDQVIATSTTPASTLARLFFKSELFPGDNDE